MIKKKQCINLTQLLIILAFTLFLSSLLISPLNAKNDEIKAQNPIIWADVPDPSVVRVDDKYYMTSTTMHMSPGVPIMKSTDLVNWEIVNYAYDRLIENNAMNLINSENAYGNGSWASSIQYNNGTFYIVTFSYTTHNTHIYKTEDIENGPFTAHTIDRVFHDPGLFIDEDDQVYLVYGHDNIRIIELTSDATSVKPGGLDQEIIPNASSIAGDNFILTAEGAHIKKINGYYYISLICWPGESGRTQLVYRSQNLTGPYEGRVVLQDRGIAQGGLVDTPDGDWYAMLFRDSGSVGRVPYLIPVKWEDGWPILGIDGQVPAELDIPKGEGGISGIVDSDEFEQGFDEKPVLDLVWQWNHNPVGEYWSLTERPGYLRIINERIDEGFLDTRNTLTQRTFGPISSATVALDVSNMKNGDYTGFGALQENYGFVGVKMDENSKYLVMVKGDSQTHQEIESIAMNYDTVYLGINMDFRNRDDRANFFCSIDGENWKEIGNTLNMSYTLDHFMGYRFALFNFATETEGGFVDFDYFKVSDNLLSANISTLPVNNGIIQKDNSKQSYVNIFPNPFRNKTRISYKLPAKTYVKIQVFDMHGKLVEVLINEVKDVGNHSMNYNASHLENGTYFYKVETDYDTTVGKMVLIK